MCDIRDRNLDSMIEFVGLDLLKSTVYVRMLFA